MVGAAGCCVLLAVSLLLCLPLFAWDHATAVCLFYSPPSMLVFALSPSLCVGTMMAHTSVFLI